MASHAEPKHPHLASAPLWRRLLALIYDGVLLFGLLVVVTLCLVFINDGEAVSGPGLQAILYLTCMLFYLTSWRMRGQTPGMLVWRIRAQNEDGSLLSLQQHVIRFLVSTLSLALLGLGFFWALADRQKRTWQDLASGSRVVTVQR